MQLKKNIFSLLLFGIIGLLSLTVTEAQSEEEKIIAYARNIKVSDLDSTLPEQPIEEWLTSFVGPKTTILWEVNDCGEQSGIAGDSSSTNPPACAQVTSNLEDGRTLGIQILVGTFKEGIKGKPEPLFIYVENQGKFKSVQKLQELPSLIRK